MGAGQRDHRCAPPVVGDLGSRGGNRDRRMGIDQRARSGVSLGDGLHRLSVVHLVSRKQAARGAPSLVVLGHRAGAPEIPHGLADSGAITALQLEQQPLEIARHLDVHARAEARLDCGERHAPARKIPSQNIVAVGADYQPIDRHSHLAGDVSGIDIAEIAGRDAERNRSRRRAQRDRGGDVVYRLRGDSSPVDRVHRRQVQFVPQSGIGE